MKHVGLIVSGCIVVVVGIFLVANYISFANEGVKHEEGIKAAYEDNKNVLGQYSLKVVEAAGVTSKFAEDLTEVTTAALSGRYGENGSQATFQWIKENYPGTLDPALYGKVQQIIESGRTDFQNKQTALNDRKRVYNERLAFFWSGLWLGFAGYPKIDLDEYKIITSQHAVDSFENGVEKPIEFN
jgi:hypothetical protein